jgi:hypothetical protein
MSTEAKTAAQLQAAIDSNEERTQHIHGRIATASTEQKKRKGELGRAVAAGDAITELAAQRRLGELAQELEACQSALPLLEMDHQKMAAQLKETRATEVRAEYDAILKEWGALVDAADQKVIEVYERELKPLQEQINALDVRLHTLHRELPARPGYGSHSHREYTHKHAPQSKGRGLVMLDALAAMTEDKPFSANWRVVTSVVNREPQESTRDTLSIASSGQVVQTPSGSQRLARAGFR